jgi:hypothetical protein
VGDPINYIPGGLALEIGQKVRVKVTALRGELAVRVLNQDRFPVAGAKVMVFSDKMKVAPLETPESEQGEEAGSVVFRNLVTGSYQIRVEHQGRQSEPVYMAVQAGKAPPLPPLPAPLDRAPPPDGRPADPSVARAPFPGDVRDAPDRGGQERDAAPAPPNVATTQTRPTASSTDPNAEFPVADLIRFLEAVEKAYPKDTPEQILTRIRQQYYSGIAFRQLIPDAPHSERNPRSVTTGTDFVPRLLDRDKVDSDAFRHLTAKGDENGPQRNPSPFFLRGDEKIDLGHVLLTFDCLLHPKTAAPYTLFGVPSIDPASWIGDLSPASYWTETHQKNGSPGASGDPIKLASADVDGYYQMSAPDPDLLGDFDGFGVFKQFRLAAGQRISQAIKAYYLGPSAGVSTRCRDFCKANGLTFSSGGGRVKVDPASVQPFVARIDRLCDLFDFRDNIGVNLFIAALKLGFNTLPTPPPPRTWVFTPQVRDLFIKSLEGFLEKELRTP